MESITNFNDGMNSDLSKLIPRKNSYVQALNFRGVTELGESNGSLVNIKGNECKISFPITQDIFKLQVTNMGGNTNDSLTITVNGSSTSSITITAGTSGIQIYNLLKALPNCYQTTNGTPTTPTFAVGYGKDYVIIYQQPEYKDCGPAVQSVFPNTVVNRSTLGEGQTRGYTLMFIDTAKNPQPTQNNGSYVLTHNNLYIIGSTFIGEDIYLLTADEEVGIIPANDSFTGTSHIWKLSIDDITKQHTLTLLYTNYLDLTRFHPVAPSAITGRYESSDIKRIYWTDFYSKIRTLNVADPQLMAYDPILLSVTPRVNFTQAILQGIGSGSLDAGCYQLSYRMSKTLGAVTNISAESAPVYLTATPESNTFENYYGASGPTGKSIIWQLDNLDTNYDQIEFIVTYRNYASITPTIKSLGTVTLLSSMTVTYADAANEDYEPVNLEEYLLLANVFTHAKTVDTKDNRLFWGNIKVVQKELESFDSRAFRANDLGQIKLTNNGISGIFTPSTAQATLFTEDTINEYYTSSGDYSANACYLKPSTATTTKILGGEGKYISYEFGTQSIQTDGNFKITSGSNYDIANLPLATLLRPNNPAISDIDLTYHYPQNGKWTSLKQPERTSILRGFQHEEIYRFGIQFFDLEGNPYFTKWIGDIKMPSYGDINNNPDGDALGNGINDFRLSYGAASNTAQYAQILYVKFTVDVSSLEGLIGGYQIVRVKREGSNRTIWGCGMLNPFWPLGGNDLTATSAVLPASWDGKRGDFVTPGPVNNPNTRYYSPAPTQRSVETLNVDSSYGDFDKYKMFDCWDTDAGLRPGFSAGDKILIRGRLKCINYNADGAYRAFFGTKNNDSSGNPVPPDNQRINYLGTTPPFTTDSNNDSGAQEPFFIMKMNYEASYANYQAFLTSGFAQDFTLAKGEYLLGNTATVSSVGGKLIKNYGEDADTGSIGVTGNPSYGKQTLFVEFTTPLHETTAPYNCVANDPEFKKLLALYYKPNNSLYGGATYVARTNNEYIACGEYIPVVQNNIPSPYAGSYTFNNFGGDTFTVIYDMMKTVKSNGATYRVYEHNGSGVFQGLATRQAKFSTSFFFPCTTVYNAELRTGAHPNRSLQSDGGYGEDEYEYNDYCNAESDVKKFFAKPLNFQFTDEWINRIYFSEVKFNNETQDSWSVYNTNNFYDVEGNYGGINCLISLNGQMHYIQDRGIGMLLINPVAMVNAGIGSDVKLGQGKTIERHLYKGLDIGTKHQWSVYRSQSQILFLDVRHKKLYSYNGEQVTPISDLGGQRNFIVKKLHDNILVNDNPIIGKGILTTYDYYHNEFLITFLNENTEQLSNSTDEFYTIAFSEFQNKFSSYYSFKPNIYINNNKYLLSNVNSNSDIKSSIYFHNYGRYGEFYGVLNKSTLKTLINDNPKYTKIFDNLIWLSESIKDNIEWSDDLNIYPGAITNPSYPDNVNNQSDTFNRVRVYNDWQNTDFTTLTLAPPNNNLTRKERNFNLQIPRNKFDYDVNNPSTSSLFENSKLTRMTFGERIRDKYIIVDLEYPNTANNRFIINNLQSIYRISDR